ncbi:MAG: transglutaminase domain-containing protein [Spirochaetaceae bacterium]|nr:transglutaminase domain-containing protein [Spirochaetaceae bacterium]
MDLKLLSENIDDYLEKSEIIDFDDAEICALADKLWAASANEADFIKRAYEFVRDNISHSADACKDEITIKASDVLKKKHGICFAKSHLLAAILRCKNVPCGFCYQKLLLDDETAPVLILHGLNAVWLSEHKKWVRLDARGNKPGVNAQFSTEKEQLAFPVRTQKGETDFCEVFPAPDVEVIVRMRCNKTRAALWSDLPVELSFKWKN